ncbi:alpha/beta fold hydrolase [Pseudomonas profundi]|uniref:alpha/beta fold hydrolase n=1 Tax=Pseudomonas profundi TaxID=1981513 RepID=UPI00123C2A80|nr:alpha/beta hydrolase [Pseudomonas profundi]
MANIEQRILEVNGIELSVHIAGPADGQPVWLLHGFPECWYSWRHQIDMLAAEGYRVHAPEMRGYGRSSAPDAPEQYDIITLCGDIQAAMDLLGLDKVAMVGHDWGALVAWHLALLEPTRIQALCCMSVPFAGRPRMPAIHKMRELFADRFHYIVYFQEIGPAERELEADIARTLRLVMHGLSSNTTAPGEGLIQNKPAGSGWLEGLQDPGEPPAWCPPDAFAVYLDSYQRSGFHGPLNWYRNFERSWERTEHLAGKTVDQPTLFLIGDRDQVGQLEAHTIKRMPSVVPKVEQHVIPDCGHWIQAEKPEPVNQLLLSFLQKYFSA